MMPEQRTAYLIMRDQNAQAVDQAAATHRRKVHITVAALSFMDLPVALAWG
jgi:hypothetical protein